MDRLSALEKTGTSSTRSGPSSSSDGTAECTTGPVLFAPSYLEIKGWCSFKDRNTLGLTEGQAREFVTKLRQGIGSDLDSMIARVGAMRVRNTKIICYLKNPSLSNCKQIREAMCAYIERENIKLGGATPYVVEEKPVWRQEQQRTFGKALGVAEHLAKEHRKTCFYRMVPVLSSVRSRVGGFATYSSSINSIRSSNCECSRGRNVGNNGRQTGYGVQTRDTMTGPRSLQD